MLATYSVNALHAVDAEYTLGDRAEHSEPSCGDECRDVRWCFASNTATHAFGSGGRRTKAGGTRRRAIRQASCASTTESTAQHVVDFGSENCGGGEMASLPRCQDASCSRAQMHAHFSFCRLFCFSIP